ncbi:molecular chaperone GrpE [Butyrivibrio hungatei DSM 14810]|uniref:Protein GrpE n=1 Tax=Butyrivibrio hungatei DSM 14810 TaxID=1121132 RepID=A0A1M7SVZ5_9FIRM|nr:nucleotide exchange factor GrpE [Butyrivibrio hungatei]SHN62564.1 molecular chaperone GrpE [Butyrivibrio hungatei DSM 14810]
MGNKENKEVHGKAKKPVSEADKEVLENIMEELEKEAEEKEEKAAEETASEENVTEAEAETSEETKKEKKDPLKEKIDELNDKVMRQMAEFENFRKRTDKEKAQMFEQGQANVLEKLLPVVDNFERGLAAVPEADKDGAFADGMNKIYKQLMKQLEDLGVTPIEAVGKEFDPNLHNAVMQVESEEYESGMVAQELQKGYMFHETVLRHSMVGVSQ